MGNSQTAFRFGDWLVEPHLNRLSRAESERHLEPLAMDVLAHLLAHPGQVVTTDELLNRVWSGTRGEPSMVAKRVNQIRRVLGDDARHPTYVETITKRGYRVIAEVSCVGDIGDQSVAQPAALPMTQSKRTPSIVSQRPRALATVALLAAVGLFAWGGFQRFGGDQKTPIRSLAVLPLENLSGDPAQEYVADGMTEEITTELGKLRELRVVSRTSVMRYKADRPPAATIADELGVDGILEGSVAREAGRFRVTVQLIDARSDRHLWAESFDRDVSSVLSLRSDVAREVAEQLEVELASDELGDPEAFRAVSEAAYDAYLSGISSLTPTSDRGIKPSSASEDFQRAVALDPGFAEAWTELAMIEIGLAAGNRDHFPTAQQAVDRALAIDATLSKAHAAQGFVRFLRDWDSAGAQLAFERALKLSPNDPTALYGYHIILRSQERLAESIQVAEQMQQIVPRDLVWRSELLIGFLQGRLYERTLTEADRVRLLDPSMIVPQEAEAFCQLGRFEDSYRARIGFYRRCGESCAEARAAAEQGWDQGGYEGMLRALLDLELALQPTDAETVFDLFAKLGDLDQAFAWLERVADARLPRLIGLSYQPKYDLMHLHPRFDVLMERLELPASPESPARRADIGRLLAFKGQAVEAVARLEQAMAESPDDPRSARWLESMAWAHFAAADYKQSIAWADRALEQGLSRHGAAFAHLLRASGLAHLDRPEVAKAALKAALESWPTPLKVDRDLRPLFLGGDDELRDRYLDGLRAAGLERQR